MIGVNLSGAFYCTHAALPAMYDNGWARVVFVSSPAGGRRPAPTTSASAAAKARLLGMTRTLALEVARRVPTWPARRACASARWLRCRAVPRPAPADRICDVVRENVPGP